MDIAAHSSGNGHRAGSGQRGLSVSLVRSPRGHRGSTAAGSCANPRTNSRGTGIQRNTFLSLSRRRGPVRADRSGQESALLRRLSLRAHRTIHRAGPALPARAQDPVAGRIARLVRRTQGGRAGARPARCSHRHRPRAARPATAHRVSIRRRLRPPGLLRQLRRRQCHRAFRAQGPAHGPAAWTGPLRNHRLHRVPQGRRCREARAFLVDGERLRPEGRCRACAQTTRSSTRGRRRGTADRGPS